MDYSNIMESSVTTKNMTSIPAKIAKATGIRPGWKLDWTLGDQPEEIKVRVIPDRTEQARRLFGQGKDHKGSQDVIAQLIEERDEELQR